MSRLIEVDKMLLAVIESKQFVFRHEDMKNDEVVIRTVYKDLAEFVESLPTTTESEIRAKAIDEFAEQIIENVEINWVHDLSTVADSDSFIEEIKVIAEQLRGNEE